MRSQKHAFAPGVIDGDFKQLSRRALFRALKKVGAMMLIVAVTAAWLGVTRG